MGTKKALTPQEIKKGIGLDIPDFVIESVNKLLAKSCGGNAYAKIKKKDIVTEIIANHPGTVTSDQIHKNGWLNFEPIFREAGWKVSYDKPGFNESYDACYEFAVS